MAGLRLRLEPAMRDKTIVEASALLIRRQVIRVLFYRHAHGHVHATLEIIAAARPLSSARTETFTVTPVLAEYAILINAATRPPATDFP